MTMMANQPLFEKQGLTVDANGNATVDLTFKDDSEKGKSRFGVFLKFKDTKNNVFVGYEPRWLVLGIQNSR